MLQNQLYSAFKKVSYTYHKMDWLRSQHPAPYADLLSIFVRLKWSSQKMGDLILLIHDESDRMQEN